MRPGKRMHSPSLTSPRRNLWSSFTFWTHCLAVSWLPGALKAHSPDTERDLIGRDRKYKHHKHHEQVQQERERGHKHNRGCAQHARCAKTPDLLSRKSARLRQWNKPGLTGVRQSSCSRQNQAGPTWQVPSPSYTLSTSIPLATLTPPAVFPGCSLCVFRFFFVYYLSLLIYCFSGVMLPAQRDNNITTDSNSSHSVGRQKPLCSVSGNDLLGAVRLSQLLK